MRLVSSVAILALALSACTKDEPLETGDTSSDTDTDTDTDSDTDSDTDTDTNVDTDTAGYDTSGGYDTGGWYSGDYFSLDFSGTGYNPHIGKVWWLALYDAEGLFVDEDEGTVAEDGTIDAYLYGSLDLDQAYRVDLIADANGNRLCDTVPDDHMWQYDVPAVTADVALTDVHTTTFANDAAVCEGWLTWHYDTIFSGTGFNPHAGQTIHYALVDTDLQDIYFTFDDQVATDGTIAVTFPDSFAGSTPFLDLVWYVDSNGTPGCQPLTDTTPDHQWSEALFNYSADVTITYPHDTNFTDVCWAFPA